ncbi:hypothetical protein ACH5RR_041110 [Cinchona calisaya]|uniref:Rubber elongation factor protein n=1 Tax=Cinchona calisaya TaxID=153742 RepID=A0ABD2XY22_9GENT
MKEESEEKRLKYFEFVQVAALHAVLCTAKLYDYAKDNSGPLKPSVQSIEGTVKNVVGPIYDKFHDVPVELLKFLDRKVFFCFLFLYILFFLVLVLFFEIISLS